MEGTSYEGRSDEEVARLCTEQLPYVTSAFEEILRRYEPVVLRTCYRYLGDLAEAEEACQDVFLRIYGKISQFEGRSSLRTWLYRIVFNVCSSRRTKMQRRSQREVMGGEVRQKRAGNLLMTPNFRVEQALGQLSPGDKEILLLRFDDDLSLEDIAQVMGLELSATKMRLYRSMERFKRIYTEVEKETSEG
ncbi:MAG: RNA polymerase sigma factor [bacterium]